MDKITKENWREVDLNVDSLWVINERDKSGKHSNVYHGNFIPQIPNQLIRRYTSKGDTVLELFSGSGTTLFECENLGRDYIGFDINTQILQFVKEKMQDCTSIRFDLCECDVTDEVSFSGIMNDICAKRGISNVDFIIAHPPYMDIVKFTQDERDLSHISRLEPFLDKFVQAMKNGMKFLKSGGYSAVVAGDVYKQSEVVPLAFYMMNAVKKNFDVKLKGIIIKNIEGNRGKLGAEDIWKYRALQSDYFLFKHEYIFVFKKIG
ncbi:MAG: DNA methyltransferase [Candidatus Cryptobacteroides sp.]|nr:DNA methyltransferase [Bacteroidales bacterium]